MTQRLSIPPAANQEVRFPNRTAYVRTSLSLQSLRPQAFSRRLPNSGTALAHRRLPRETQLQAGEIRVVTSASLHFRRVAWQRETDRFPTVILQAQRSARLRRRWKSTYHASSRIRGMTCRAIMDWAPRGFPRPLHPFLHASRRDARESCRCLLEARRITSPRNK